MSHTAADFEQAVSLTGYGRFHHGLFSFCALSMLTVGFQNGLAAYIIPAAQCDLQLASEEMGLLNVFFLIGGICSCFLWGILADIVGRRNVLLYTLLSDWFFTLCSSLTQTFTTLTIFRFLSGFFVGASGTLVFSYLAEFQSARIRAKIVLYVGLFLAAAWVLLPAIAWAIIPHRWEYRSEGGFVFNSWRMFLMALSCPSLVCTVWAYTLPESPKFLHTKGDMNGALSVLRKMYGVNQNCSPDEYQVKILLDDSLSIKLNPDQTHGAVGRGRTARLFNDFAKQTKLLFQPPYRLLNVLTSLMLLTNMVGYYGLGLWLPEIFTRFEEYTKYHPLEKKTFCEIQDFCSRSVFDVSTDNFTTTNRSIYLEENSCNDKMDATVFINTIVMGACCLVGNAISGHLAGRIDQRIVPVFTMLTGGVCSMFIYWFNSGTQLLIIASLFQATMATSNMAINGVIVELFPTSVSAMAVCCGTLAGRFGAIFSNLAFGYLLDKSCWIPIFTVTFVLIVGGLLGLLLPSSNREANKIKPNIKKHTIPEVAIISK